MLKYLNINFYPNYLGKHIACPEIPYSTHLPLHDSVHF